MSTYKVEHNGEILGIAQARSPYDALQKLGAIQLSMLRNRRPTGIERSTGTTIFRYDTMEFLVTLISL